MTAKGTAHRILVFGDAAIDLFLEEHESEFRGADSHSAPRADVPPGWRIHRQMGGVLLLARMIEMFSSNLVSVVSPLTFLDRTEPVQDQIDRIGGQLVHSLAEVVHTFSANRAIRWRISRFLNYSAGGPGRRGGSGSCPITSGTFDSDTAFGDVLIIDDAGWGFRNVPTGGEKQIWPALLRGQRIRTRPAGQGLGHLLVIKLSGRFDNLFDSRLWQRLASVRGRFGHRVIVINADDLRLAGLDVSRRLSWDRTLRDIKRLAKHGGGLLRQLLDYGDVVVRLDLDGAAVVRAKGKGARIDLVADPCAVEGDFVRNVWKQLNKGRPSMSTGTTAAFVAAIVRSLTDGTVDLVAAAQAGLVAGRVLYRAGLKVALHAEENSIEPDMAAAAAALNSAEPEFTIIRKFSGHGALIDSMHHDLNRLAMDFVWRGPNALAGVPILKMGGLVSADPEEIERFRWIADLLDRHLAQPDPIRPLCLAVFGLPGSGKTFGVKAIAKQLGGDDLIVHETNVAQFTGLHDLARAFHTARDAILDGKVPLIFFDEFDASTAGGKHGWLGFFLAPMQDGVFMDDGVKQSIRRAVFVFAGGTTPKLEEFFSASAITPEQRAAKVPDFVSRLQGFVNIADVNAEGTDRYWPLRRASVLRSLLLKYAPRLEQDNQIRIDEAVLRAFLGVPKFHHGARSIEALIRMSTIYPDSETLDASMLPPEEQIRLHTSAEAFKNQLGSPRNSG